MVLKWDSVSVNKGLALEFHTISQVLQDLNLMQNMWTQWNRQLTRYVPKVIECLKQNIRKQIDCKRPSNTKPMNRL